MNGDGVRMAKVDHPNFHSSNVNHTQLMKTDCCCPLGPERYYLFNFIIKGKQASCRLIRTINLPATFPKSK